MKNGRTKVVLILCVYYYMDRAGRMVKQKGWLLLEGFIKVFGDNTTMTTSIHHESLIINTRQIIRLVY